MKGAILLIVLSGLTAQPARAQALGAAAVQQIPSKSSASARTIQPGSATADIVRVAPVRGGSSSAIVQEVQRETPTPSVPPEVVEACRAAQAEDRAPPKGVNCMAAMQALAEAQPQVTAESSLLELFGRSGNVTGTADDRSRSTVNADAVARQLSTGDVQSGSGDTAAGVAARERGAPPANSPR